MSDSGKDELRARFEEHKQPDQPDEAGETDQPNETDNSSNTENTADAPVTEEASTTGKPGRDRDPDATRNRRQVALYLPETVAEDLDQLYDRLDGRAKIAGQGGIEKNKDFWEAAAQLILENEDKLAERIDVPLDS